MRRTLVVPSSVLLLAAACSPVVVGSEPDPRRDPDVVVVGDERGRDGPRALGRVPPGHYPPPGHCRVWYAGRPPGHQPPPTRCGALRGRIPIGAFILYDDAVWDTGYDWFAHERRRPGSVPGIILELIRGVERR